MSLQTVTPGWIESGTGYTNFKNALVEEDTVVWEVSFRADFTLVNGGYDYISNVWESLIQINFGTYNLQFFDIDKSTENASGPAIARQQFDYTIQGAFTHTVIIYLVVGLDRYYSDVVSTE